MKVLSDSDIQEIYDSLSAPLCPPHMLAFARSIEQAVLRVIGKCGPLDQACPFVDGGTDARPIRR